MFKFNSMAAAVAFISRAVKPMAGILGDDGLIWVVSLADAAVLMAQGYEEAE